MVQMLSIPLSRDLKALELKKHPELDSLLYASHLPALIFLSFSNFPINQEGRCYKQLVKFKERLLWHYGGKCSFIFLVETSVVYFLN